MVTSNIHYRSFLDHRLLVIISSVIVYSICRSA